MYEAYRRYCTALQNARRYRTLGRVLHPATHIDFSTNDYLALSQHPALLSAAAKAARTYGVGSTGSRLLSGNKAIFEKLEHQIAADKHTASALIFNSGFQANVSALASLLHHKVFALTPLVFFDKLNHASLYEAVRLSRAELVRYRHLDMHDLSRRLTGYQHDHRPKFIVTETLFGMDGDVLPLETVVQLAKKHHAFLYLDEAHATGMLGKHGYGLSTTQSLRDIRHLIMGTFSKALGCSGAYVACSDILKTYLLNTAPGFIYSTALSPMVIGAVYQAWRMIKQLNVERKKIWALAHQVRIALQKAGFNTGTSCSQIIPIILGEEKTAMAMQDKLLRHGLLVSSVRPPSVPPGTSRLRIALSACHTEQSVAYLIETLQKC